MINAVEEHQADALGMSGLLVKSTLIMRENLEELNQRGLAECRSPRWRRTHPHLRRARLRGVYEGRLFYGRDAFEGLRTMDASSSCARAVRRTGVRREISERAVRAAVARRAGPAPPGSPSRSPEISTDNPCSRRRSWQPVAKGIAIDDIAEY